MSVREKDNPDLYNRIQEQNLLRQYDLLTNCIEIGLEKGIEAFDKYTLWALNYTAVANIAQFGGRYREEPIYVSDHVPPRYEEVPHQMDLFLFLHPRKLDGRGSWRSSDRAGGLRPLATELDSSFRRGERQNSQGSLLLPNLPEAGPGSPRQEDRSRTYTGKPTAVLRRIEGRRSEVGRRAPRRIADGALPRPATQGPTL